MMLHAAVLIRICKSDASFQCSVPTSACYIQCCQRWRCCRQVVHVNVPLCKLLSVASSQHTPESSHDHQPRPCTTLKNHCRIDRQLINDVNSNLKNCACGVHRYTHGPIRSDHAHDEIDCKFCSSVPFRSVLFCEEPRGLTATPNTMESVTQSRQSSSNLDFSADHVAPALPEVSAAEQRLQRLLRVSWF